MVQKIESILKSLQLELNNKKVLLACSTGVDSMVLFDMLCKCKSLNDIVIAHVNHQKRQQSTLEETYILEVCKKLGIKCYVKRLEHYDGNSFQSWARDERYKFFEEVAKQENVDTILLAHHGNDNLETILLRMIRSASLEGYAGIRQHSKYHNIDIYRPLLELSKDDIIEYAKNNDVKYFEDASNSSDDYTRNRIRHHIIPVLQQENPALLKSIQNYSHTLFEASDFIENYETNFIKTNVIVNNNSEYFAKFEIECFLKENAFLQEQILFRILKPFTLSKECIKDTLKQIQSNKRNIVQCVNNELLMIKEYGYVIFTTEKRNNDPFFLKIEEEGIYNLPSNKRVEVSKNICNLYTTNSKIWYNINSLPIIIRTRKDGDKITKKSGTITVSNYLTNHKVPLLERDKVLLLCNGDNKPVAILGYVIK